MSLLRGWPGLSQSSTFLGGSFCLIFLPSFPASLPAVRPASQMEVYPSCSGSLFPLLVSCTFNSLKSQLTGVLISHLPVSPNFSPAPKYDCWSLVHTLCTGGTLYHLYFILCVYSLSEYRHQGEKNPCLVHLCSPANVFPSIVPFPWINSQLKVIVYGSKLGEESLAQNISWEIHSVFAEIKPGPTVGFTAEGDSLKLR